MESTFNLKLHAAGAALTAALLSGACAMFEPRAERYVPPPVGATWVHARRDSGSFGSASIQLPGKFLGQQMWQGRMLNGFETPESSTLAMPESGLFVAVVKGSAPLITWEPPIGWNWPLEVGKTWTKSTRVTNHVTKQTTALDYTQKVEAYEDVTVPAGTFKTFKVSTVNTIGDESVNWFSPDLGIFVKQSLRRTAKHAQGAGAREIELVSQKIK
jgi:hypothetical protein